MKSLIKNKLNLDNRVNLQDVIPIATPFLIYVDPSSLCNFRCKFCPMGHSKITENLNYKRTILSFEIFTKMIKNLNTFPDNLKVLRMNKVGEPLMNKEIVKMVEYAKASGKVNYIDMATNAALLTDDTSLGLVNAGIDRINISIEGINDIHYQQYCNSKIDFYSLVERVKFLYKNKKNTGITIKIPSNYISKIDQDEFISIFSDYCDRIFVENLADIWPNFNLNESLNIDIEEKHQYGAGIEEKKVCSYIFYSMVVNANGTVSACCPDWEEKLIIGDLKEQTLFEIWNSNELKKLRMEHLENRRHHNEICGNCGHIKYCQIDNIDAYSDDILRKIEI